MIEGTPEAELTEIIRTLNGTQQRQLLGIARSLATPIDVEINYAAGLITLEFEEEFTARLQAHHGTHSKQLDRIPMEDAFRASSQAAGRNVFGPLSATTRFYDEIIDGQKIALKSTAAKDVKEESLHISKLSEAAWIQDVRGAKDRMDKAKGQVKEYLDAVDRLFQLRVIPSRTMWIYQLVEVPMGLFQPILLLDKSDFNSDSPRIVVEDGSGTCMTFILDRSDAKITIAKVPIGRCVVHGRWSLPKATNQ